jgi:RimJ/RimL family protein N-acetyltransferase
MQKFILGKRIYLRGLTENEISVESPYYDWLDDLSLDLYTERSYYPNSPERMTAYYRRACRNEDLLLLGIFDVQSDKHIGNITLSDINYFHRRGFIAYMLGDHEFEGTGLITDAVLMLMYYAFNKLNFERIDGGVSNVHPASRRVCEKVGLYVEGTQRRHFLRNGVWHDRLIVGAIREEWMSSFSDAAQACFAQKPC